MFSEIMLGSYESQPKNLMAGRNLSLAMNTVLFSKYMLWGCTTIWVLIKANNTDWNGGLFGIPAEIQCVTNQTYTKTDKTLVMQSAPAVTTNTKYKCWIL